MNTIPTAVKIPSLLAQYFYSNQRLELPGIGTFLLDISVMPALQNSKQRYAILEGVSFENNVSLKDSSTLITFIAEKTGKMKPLASADLESHLQLAQQFLNMGKPFSFEGIGILARTNTGELEFTAISVSTETIKEFNTKETASFATKEESSSPYESFLSGPKTKLEWQKPVIGLLLLCGIGLTVWGGYVISKKNNKSSAKAHVQKIVPEATLAADSFPTQQTDSTVSSQKPLPLANAKEDNYKYVLEIAKSNRAFKRYNQLRDNRWDVRMETNDSIQYKLFLLLPSISDTSRTIDSLTVMTGRKVYIDYAN